MLCPELFNFPIPAYNIESIKGCSWVEVKKSSKIKSQIYASQFVRTLSVVIPANERQFIDSIANDLEAGSCSVILVRKFSLAEMVRKEFVEAFVKRGKLYGVSTSSRLETDDCVSISPDGTVLLSLNRETYQRLPLCRNLTSRRRDKYVVKLDLKSPVAKELLGLESLAWDMIVRWIPPKSSSNLGVTSGMAISIQSLEQYLRDSRQISIEKLPLAGSQVVKLDTTPIPLIGEQNGKDEKREGKFFCTSEELMEFIGMLVLDCNIKPLEYLSTYSPQGCVTPVDTTCILNRQGMFTPEEIEHTIDRLAEFVEEQKSSLEGGALPWVALHVAGFSNVPFSLSSTGDCGIYYDHESAYTVVISGKGDVIWRKLIGCSGRGPIGGGGL